MDKGDWFDNDNYCHKHGNKNCIGCRAAMEKKNIDIQSEEYSKALIIAPIQSDFSSERSIAKQIELSDVFHKQADMLQAVLELSDDDLAKIKIADIPKMMKKAQAEANIGHMKKLLAPRPGFLEKLLFRKG